MASMGLKSRLKIEDLFASLKDESEQEKERKLIKCNNKELDEIIQDFKRWITKYNYDTNKFREKARVSTATGIESFSLVIPDLKEEITRKRWQPITAYSFEIASGYYLNALINNSRENEFNICTRAYDYLIPFLGFCNNGKIININGDIGDSIGNSMSSGKITVHGDVKALLGGAMEGGEIHIYGNAGESIGHMMKKGNIFLEGEYTSLAMSSIFGGNIYHKGVQIVKEGIRVDRRQK